MLRTSARAGNLPKKGYSGFGDYGKVESIIIFDRIQFPFVAGPHLNLYNSPALRWMATQSAQRWVAPLEMNRNDLALLHNNRPAGLQTEVFALGRMPLAFSARCFTARHHNLRKDECGFRCIEHPNLLCQLQSLNQSW